MSAEGGAGRHVRVVSVLLSFALGAAACDAGTMKPGTAAAPSEATHSREPSGACPREMALVALSGGPNASPAASVCVDRYEAAVNGWRFSQPLDGIDAGGLEATSGKGVMPQVNLSEVEAEAACGRAKKRLCTEDEWVAACRGSAKNPYPYGHEYVPGACNDARPSPVTTVFGPSGGRLDDPRLAEAPDGIAPGGSFPRCVTADGLFDMHGNVHEWVSTSPHPDDPRLGEFLGGFFADAKENGAGCAYKTTAHLKAYHDYSIGFRCCMDPDRGS